MPVAAYCWYGHRTGQVSKFTDRGTLVLHVGGWDMELLTLPHTKKFQIENPQTVFVECDNME
jgi:hypothetical protein